MVQAEIRSISIFFFLAFLDGNLATEASNQAVTLFQKKLSENSSLDRTSLVVTVTKEIWNKHQHRFQRKLINFSNDSGWILPNKLNLVPWKEFRKLAQEEEVFSLIWSHILGIKDEKVASGAHISVGTHRYRIGNALKKLGSLTSIEES